MQKKQRFTPPCHSSLRCSALTLPAARVGAGRVWAGSQGGSQGTCAARVALRLCSLLSSVPPNPRMPQHPTHHRTRQLAETRLAHAHEGVAGVHLLGHQRLGGRHKHHLALHTKQGWAGLGLGRQAWRGRCAPGAGTGGMAAGTGPLLLPASTERTPWHHLRKPAAEVVHHHSGDQRLAQPGGQADQRVCQQRGLQA